MMTQQRQGLRARIREEIYTYCAFCVAASAVPLLAVSYVVVRVSKFLWLKLLSSRYPGLEFIRTDTVRSLLDTHRNQGIINVLLSVKGTLDAEQIKNHLTQHIIEKRNKNGELMFPRLRHLLVSSWGNYAWDARVAFSLENHFTVANAVYRGRQVGENNIQEYVSEIISKYFPPEQPPWQYIVIPCVAPEPKYYILVRVHHLLLSGRKALNIGDFLLMEQLDPTERTITPAEYTQKSPVAMLFPTPSAIPELWGKLNENLSNAWNEFVSEYDPVESPRALKSLPGMFHVAGLVLIATATALRELNKKSNGRQATEASQTAFNLIATIQRECHRRRLTIPKIIFSPLVTADPRKWPSLAFNTTLSSISMFVTLPIRVWNECIALNELKSYGHARRPDTLTWKYGEMALLCVKAVGEAWNAVVEVYRAPARLWTDIVHSDDGKRHLLQTVSLCGRKVTAWSRPVPRSSIERVARALGVSSSDVALYAATESLRAFFEHAHADPPEVVLATARAHTDDFLFAFAEKHGKSYKKSQSSGMVCLPLCLGASPRRVACISEQARSRQRALIALFAAQAHYGAVTRALPSALARLVLNMLSRRYALAYAQVEAPVNVSTRRTIWGDVVDSVVYWRPSQANISMSLTLIEYGDTVRLAVMSDARLVPAHTVPATRWATAVDQLVAKVDQEIAKITAQHNMQGSRSIPDIITPGDSSLTEEYNQEVDEQAGGPDTLRPPTTTAVSPPPMRRRISHN